MLLPFIFIYLGGTYQAHCRNADGTLTAIGGSRNGQSAKLWARSDGKLYQQSHPGTRTVVKAVWPKRPPATQRHA